MLEPAPAPAEAQAALDQLGEMLDETPGLLDMAESALRMRREVEEKLRRDGFNLYDLLQDLMAAWWWLHSHGHPLSEQEFEELIAMARAGVEQEQRTEHAEPAAAEPVAAEPVATSAPTSTVLQDEAAESASGEPGDPQSEPEAEQPDSKRARMDNPLLRAASSKARARPPAAESPPRDDAQPDVSVRGEEPAEESVIVPEPSAPPSSILTSEKPGDRDGVTVGPADQRSAEDRADSSESSTSPEMVAHEQEAPSVPTADARIVPQASSSVGPSACGGGAAAAAVPAEPLGREMEETGSDAEEEEVAAAPAPADSAQEHRVDWPPSWFDGLSSGEEEESKRRLSAYAERMCVTTIEDFYKGITGRNAARMLRQGAPLYVMKVDAQLQTSKLEVVDGVGYVALNTTSTTMVAFRYKGDDDHEAAKVKHWRTNMECYVSWAGGTECDFVPGMSKNMTASVGTFMVINMWLLHGFDATPSGINYDDDVGSWLRSLVPQTMAGGDHWQKPYSAKQCAGALLPPLQHAHPNLTPTQTPTHSCRTHGIPTSMHPHPAACPGRICGRQPASGWVRCGPITRYLISGAPVQRCRCSTTRSRTSTSSPGCTFCHGTAAPPS